MKHYTSRGMRTMGSERLETMTEIIGLQGTRHDRQ